MSRFSTPDSSPKDAFFGVGPADKVDLIFEPQFLLIYYLGFSLRETMNISVAQKRWFIERVVKELKRTSDEGQTQSRALHQNDPQTREMMGRTRSQTPSRLRRFS